MMNQIRNLVFTVILITFYTCTSSPEIKVKKDSVDENLIYMQIQDSIRKIKELEITQTRQDSIEDSKIGSYSIKRISGKHKYGGITKIEYKSLSQILSETEKKAKKEMWTDENLKSHIYRNIQVSLRRRANVK